MRAGRKPWWQQATALVTVSTGGVITGFNFVPGAAATMTSPTSVPLHLLALERAAEPGAGIGGVGAEGGDSAASATTDAQLRAAIVNVAAYYLRLAQTKTPAQMEALIWDNTSSDGADHGPSCAAFASLTLELAAQAVGQQSWVSGGSTYPWPLPEWADVRVEQNPDSPGITSLVADAQAHGRWHSVSAGYQPRPGDWVVFNGHVEVVTSYSGGVLDSVGADSAPDLSVNAHSFAAPLADQGVLGFVDNGQLQAAMVPGSGATPAAGASHGDSSGGSAGSGGSGSSAGSAGAGGSAVSAGSAGSGSGSKAAIVPGVVAPTADGGESVIPGTGLASGGKQAATSGTGTASSSGTTAGAGDIPGVVAPGAITAAGAATASGTPKSTGADTATPVTTPTTPATTPTTPTTPTTAPATSPTAAATAPATARATSPTVGATAGGQQYQKYDAPEQATPGTRAQQAFINLVSPGAVAAQQRYGVPAAVTIAQAIEESAWGGSSLAATYHNLFGIKGTGPAGSVLLPTSEYENGHWVTVAAPFRVYHNDAESIADHAELIATSGYYTRAMADRAVPDAFANDLTGVYATDPDYGANLIALMKLYNLYRFDSQGAPAPAAAATPTPTSSPAPTTTPTTTPTPAATGSADSGTPGPSGSGSASSGSASSASASSASASSASASSASASSVIPGVVAPAPVAPSTSTSATGQAGTGQAGTGQASSGAGSSGAARVPGIVAPGTVTSGWVSHGAGAASGRGGGNQPGSRLPGSRQPGSRQPASRQSGSKQSGSSIVTTAAMRYQTVRYQTQLPAATATALFATAKAPLARGEHLYRDVAAQTGIAWELLAACDWMQCKADPRRSPVCGERIGTLNSDGTAYATKSAALAQCARDLITLAGAVYGINLSASAPLSVRGLADTFAAFRWGAILRRHGVSAMEFPYAVAGLTAAHQKMHWPNVDDQDAPDRPGARFREPFGAVPVVLSLHYPATV